MPNHVANRITFDCSDEKAKEILQSIMYDPKPDDEENTGPGTIDFGKLIPMPKSLMIEAGSTTTRGIEIYLTAVNPDTEDYDLPKMPKDKFDELVNALNGERIFYKYNPSLSEEEIRSATEYHSFGICADLGKQAITNFQNYGATTWYDWSVRNWGTKWNSYDPYKEDDHSLVFSTAWSAPHPVVEALSKKFPDVSFHHEWADEDIGYNCGSMDYRNGEVVSAFEPESMKEAIAFANRVWGYDDEEENTEDVSDPVSAKSPKMTMA